MFSKQILESRPGGDFLRGLFITNELNPSQNKASKYNVAKLTVRQKFSTGFYHGKILPGYWISFLPQCISIKLNSEKFQSFHF